MALETFQIRSFTIMTTETIIKELDKLPLTDKLLVLERTLKSMRQDREKNLSNAVKVLYDEYKTDKELTIFSQLDKDPFYETR